MSSPPRALAAVLAAIALSLGSPLPAQTAKPATAPKKPAAAAATPKKAPAVPAAPRPAPPPVLWKSSTRVLTAATALEVRFTAQMVAREIVGDEEAGANPMPVTVTPALKGKFVWRSQQSGVFSPEEEPAAGETYTFSVRDGLADMNGTPLPEAQAFSVKAAGLSLTHRYPTWFSSRNAPRLPELILQFNRPVSPETAGNAIFFQDSAGRTAPAVVTQTTVGKLPQRYSMPPAFRQRALAPLGEKADEANLPKDTALPATLTAKPASPLPVGEKWSLVVGGNVASADNSVQTLEPQFVPVGDIPAFSVDSLDTRSDVESGKRLIVAFTKDPAADVTADQVLQRLSIKPAVPNQKVELSGSMVTVTGDFKVLTPYQVALKPGLTSADGLSMATAYTGSISFDPLEPVVALPSLSASQMAGGRQMYEIEAVNMASVTVRVKAADRDSLVFGLRGYRSYWKEPEHEENADAAPTPDEEDTSAYHRIPYEAMPGREVLKKKLTSQVALDGLDTFKLDWKELLAGQTGGAFFLTVEGEAKPEWTGKKKRFGAQAFVQLTDLGLTWKVTPDDAMVYVFSQQTGQPVAGATVLTLDDNNKTVGEAKTDASGGATVKRSGSHWLMVEQGTDRHAVPFDEDIEMLGMWRMGVDYEWDPPKGATREVALFTDRPLYLPGDTVFFKSFTRLIDASGVKMAAPGEKVKLSAFDSKNKVIAQREVTFSDRASFDGSLELPKTGALGSYRLTLVFPTLEQKDAKADKPADGEEEASGEEQESENTFSAFFNVEEFKPNAFQVKFGSDKFKLEGEAATLPLSAGYLLGKPLSKAKLAWTAEVRKSDFGSEAWPDYLFLDSRSSYYYDEEGYHEVPNDRSGGDDRDESAPLVTGQGKTELGEKGDALLAFTVPEAPFANMPRKVGVTAEVTDINQQTISETYSKTIHPSQFYLGIREAEEVRSAGDPVSIDLAVAAADESPWQKPVDARVVVEKVAFNTVRVQTVGGGSNTRTDISKSVIAEGTVTVMPKGQLTQSFVWNPKEPGFYYVTAKANDPDGKPVVSTTSVQVYGPGWTTWDSDDSVKIELAADKEEYKAGDVAKVLVKCPIAGKALVTVERRSVLKHFNTELKGNAQVVEIPLDASMAPNVFVSVFVTRGAADSPKKAKVPEYRVGFCRLKVADRSTRLDVALSTSQPEYRPGAAGEATAVVKDNQGKPVAGAEVTFWAADEGILTMMHFEQPDPWDRFHRLAKLGVQTGTSLQALLPEDPEELQFTNKGYVIGGGGWEAMAEKLRRNFQPVAFWQGALKTDAAGAVKVPFTVPDNLTSFRLLAVASFGADRFGSGSGSFKINKPLMLEPALPRFANVGDKITAKGIVMNNTDKPLDVEVAVTFDKLVKPVAEATKKISLAAHETSAVAFPVEIAEAGTAQWQWAAKSAGGPGDAVQSTLDIGYAEPVLREVGFASLNDQTGADNLLAAVNPELLDGRGELTVTVSNSTLGEAGAAIVHLLHYPYGCAEQTTSSMMPWLALQQLGDSVPGVKKTPEEIKAVIQKGVGRLLTMQTANGGLAYWPGGQQPELWCSAYAGIGLALAQKSGALVPQARLDELAAYLSAQLRNTASRVQPGELQDRAMACYALALFGKAEPAYHDVLMQKVQKLPHPARAFLALALMEAGGSREDVQKALDDPMEPALEKWDDNIFESRLTALPLLVWTKLDVANSVTVHLVERLLQERTTYGDWGSTFENAWAILALASEAQASAGSVKAGDVVLSFGGQSQTVKFPAKPTTQQVTFAMTGAKDARSLTAKAPAGALMRASFAVAVRPEHVPQQPRSQGYAVSRKYEKVLADGTLAPADALEVGDLVAVTLDVDAPARARYVAVDDALPSILEAMNPKFKTAATTSVANAAGTQATTKRALPWWSSFEELRKDRALFFADQLWSEGRYQLRYLTRVVAEGTVTAPSAKIEAMYSPEKFGLSGTQILSARQPAGKVAGK